MGLFYELFAALVEEGQQGLAERDEIDERAIFSDKLYRGLPVDRGAIFIYHVVHKGRPLDIEFTFIGTPLFSKRATELLTSLAPEDLSVIPAVLEGTDAKDWISATDQRFAVSILHTLDCLDQERSMYNPNRTYVQRPVIRSSAVGKTQIFRLKYATSRVIVTDRIKSAIEEAKLTGAEFRAVEST